MTSKRGKFAAALSLVEVIISIMLLGAIGAAFFGGLMNASRALIITDLRETAMNLAESQMEYIQEQDYAASYTPYTIPSEYTGYSVTIAAESLPSPADGNIQRIIVTVSNQGTTDYTLQGYKVDG